MRVAVVGGGGDLEDGEGDLAEEVGRLLGQRGHTVVCGGLGGVMEAACWGVKKEGGESIGVLPGRDPDAANPYVDCAVATGLGEMRNAVVVLNGDVVVALDGGAGTLSEVALAVKTGVPVVDLGGHGVMGVEEAGDALEAVELAEELADG